MLLVAVPAWKSLRAVPASKFSAMAQRHAGGKGRYRRRPRQATRACRHTFGPAHGPAPPEQALPRQHMSEQNYLGVLYSSRLLLCQCLLSIHWQLHLEHTCWCCGSGGSTVCLLIGWVSPLISTRPALITDYKREAASIRMSARMQHRMQRHARNAGQSSSRRGGGGGGSGGAPVAAPTAAAPLRPTARQLGLTKLAQMPLGDGRGRRGGVSKAGPPAMPPAGVCDAW